MKAATFLALSGALVAALAYAGMGSANDIYLRVDNREKEPVFGTREDSGGGLPGEMIALEREIDYAPELNRNLPT
jgi:hypothetical protein